MELALASDFGIYELSPESMDCQMKKLADAGITHVHWAHDWDFEYLYSQWEMLQIKELLDKYGLKCKAVHATEGNTRCRVIDGQPRFLNRNRMRDCRKDFTSPYEYNRLSGVELVLNRVDLAHLLGASEIVLHMVLPYEDFENIPGFREKYWEQAYKSFDEMQSYCMAKGVRIAIENMICTPKEYQFDKFDRLFARYPKEYMGICFDSGHSALASVDDTYVFLEKYQDRLIAMHLDDNFSVDLSLSSDRDGAIQKSDKHALPFEGVCNWEKICELIAGSPYELPLTLEIVVPHATVEEEMAGLARAKAVGEKLTEMVLAHRGS
ncbi:sugar phosphate isomerase/epimerase family protein [Feifania hominis]|uniref:Sugar phosphate isomerase/epimerase n=1 Tax=Feifania hominis TaxID=2763660 RepID=A0A926DBI2_9FIRM|nr:sugar phosphate isomerase/epimerase family protein [Feifania hominis]MBC8535493.1 sugar phosphate isomerase/epimerase [Feifania hominis]